MSDQIKDTFQTLLELKRADAKALRYHRGLGQIPLDLGKLTAKLDEKRSILDTAVNALEDAKKELRSTESDLKQKEAEIVKADMKMMEVKTNIEYKAAAKENETRKTGCSQLEDQILGLLTKVEEATRRLGEAQSQFNEHETAINAQKKELTDEAKSLEQRVSEIDTLREQLTPKLPGQIFTYYKRLRASGTADPISTVEAGKCMACRVKMRPQAYNELLGFVTIHNCANCGRVLTLPGDEPASGESDEDRLL